MSGTLADLRREGARRLAHLGVEAAREADHVIAHALRISRGTLTAWPERTVAAGDLDRVRAWLERRASGEPLAYITGEREFWSLRLEVGPDVLVPRPETELVVERALALAPTNRELRVADLGTGSGAIALALASERPGWAVVATDASAAALSTARANAHRLGLGNVSFAHGDWYEPLEGTRFDLLVSNPPYIDGADPALLDPALRLEPPSALSPGPDGLAALRTIIAGAVHHLEPGGWIVLEHGAGQQEAVAALLVAHGYARVGCHRDLAGLPRVTEALRTRES